MLATSSLPLRSTKVWSGPLTMMSEMLGSASSSSSGPRPSSSSTSTFSSANCSRRLSVSFSSASTSPMIGLNSSASSSLDRAAAASGSTRSSRRGSTCSLMRWIDASNPSWRDAAASPDAASRLASRAIASICTGGGASPSMPGSGGNCSALGGVSTGRGAGAGAPPCIGRATPKAGRLGRPAAPPRLPKALIPVRHLPCLSR